MQGAALYPQHCAVCHGVEGHGDGPAAKTLPMPPADLTAAHLWMHSDGELIWWLSHGIEAPEGGMAMPGFAGVLSERDLWDLIDFIRARNAGLVQARAGALVAAAARAGPAGGVRGRRTRLHLADLRGHIIRLVIGAPPADAGPGRQASRPSWRAPIRHLRPARRYASRTTRR